MLAVGRSLPADAWWSRHRGILVLLVVQAFALGLFALWMQAPPAHAALEALVVALFALPAASPRLPRRARASVASLGLVSASAALVHLSGGYIEAHFHFFVMLGVISLYEDWTPFLLAVGFVVVHHGLVGTFAPTSVYNHPSAFADPWIWASIHAVFVLGLSVTNVIVWSVVEETRRRAGEESLAARTEMTRSAKLAAMGSLVGGVAHEVRTPLTYIQTNLHLIERRAGGNDDVHALVASSLDGIQRINAIVETLRDYARLETPVTREATDLAPVARDALDLYRAANPARIVIEASLASTPPVRLEPHQIHQVILNLLENAAEAAPGGRVRVLTARGEDGGATLVVADAGPGIPDRVQALLFHPLVTTKPRGMGLGLSIVKRILDHHGAAIEVESTPGKGTRFRMAFPPPGAPSAGAPPRPVGHPTGLAVVAGGSSPPRSYR